mgnify:CR=1 FL=1
MAANRMKYDYPLIELTWVDAETQHGWEGDDEVDHELPYVTTVGFLIKHTIDSRGHGVYVIASTVGGGNSNSRIKVPKNMVVAEKYLYIPRKAKKEEEELNKKVVEQLLQLADEKSGNS